VNDLPFNAALVLVSLPPSFLAKDAESKMADRGLEVGSAIRQLTMRGYLSRGLVGDEWRYALTGEGKRVATEVIRILQANGAYSHE